MILKYGHRKIFSAIPSHPLFAPSNVCEHQIHLEAMYFQSYEPSCSPKVYLNSLIKINDYLFKWLNNIK